jgi:hypothetical protein
LEADPRLWNLVAPQGLDDGILRRLVIAVGEDTSGAGVGNEGHDIHRPPRERIASGNRNYEGKLHEPAELTAGREVVDVMRIA